MGIVCEHGINDMYCGWSTENEWNKRVYKKWRDMIQRVYSNNYIDKHPTYIMCTMQLELHWLSYFVEHIEEIEGYDYERFMDGELVLDKDIKSNGENKEYSINNCMFTTDKENVKQAMKTRDNTQFQGENNPMWGKGHLMTGENNHMYGKHHTDEVKRKISDAHKGEKHHSAKKVIQYTKDGKFIKIWDYIKQASDELGVNPNNISSCCRGKRKSAGGFMWRYAEE